MDDLRNQIISQFLQGKLNKEELAAFTQWRNANPENEKHVQEVKFLWENTPLAKPAKKNITIDVEAALSKVKGQLPATTQVVPMRRRFLKIAVAAAVVLIIGALGLFNIQGPEMIQVSTMVAETKKITLPDESVVWLNENSTISYPEEFDSEIREVSMTGDLVFEVTHNKEKPFIVQLDDLAVKVLGTKFNVISKGNQTTASLVHVINGKVEVKNAKKSTEKVLLEKGMTASLNHQKGELSLTDNFSNNRLFWMNQTLRYDQATLEIVLEDVQKFYEIQIDVEDPTLLSCLFTGKFEQKTADEIIETLKLIYAMKIEKKDMKNYKITKGSCN